MSLYAQFKTDETSEVEGIILDYGDFRIKAARAGGANKEYGKRVEKETRHLRREGRVPDTLAAPVFHKIFANTIIRGWETLVDGAWKSGIENPDGGPLLPPTPENVIRTFEELPDLFAHVVEQVTLASNFLQARLEDERKN